MVEIQQEEEKKARALLIGAPQKRKSPSASQQSAWDAGQKDGAGPAAKPLELEGLVKTLGMETAGIEILARIEPTPAYGIGTGKAKEIAAKAKELFADCIIFDWEIDPTKQRNWEKLCSIPVFDRNEVILRIFASRAQTKEAVLQVELARLTYSLPRLSHMYGDLARQRGGSYGSKGSGETQLELDRRQTEDKIVQIKKELEQVEQTRRTQRKQRERNSFKSCALVGYTNAGKSSLLNALTGADVFVENKLFATLDPTTRKFSLGEGSTILLTDTVGFIANLPHTLVNAFRSTLEEAAFADLLLLVVDASDPDCKRQYEQVIKVLGEIGADKIPRLILLNKWDAVKSYSPGMKTGMGGIESSAGESGAKAEKADASENGGQLAKQSDAFANGGQLAEESTAFENSGSLAEESTTFENSGPSAEESASSDNSALIASLNAAFPGAVKISAKTKEGFTELSQKITENLLGSLKSYVIPMANANLVELARKNGTILKEEWLEDGIHLEARIPGIIEENGNATTRTMALLNPYAV
ncbi:MAG: GTPase HflX [Treponema sp.]|nr:GTPase HflX [Treponema sp.]